jgi:hypothetical protein
MQGKNWLDVLSDGQLLRAWFSLLAPFFLGTAYWTFLVAGFTTAIGLSFILIGLPLLLFMLGSTRALARMDRQMMAAILDIDAPEVADDVDARGANLGERMGMYLGSLTTWRSLAYLLLQLPVGAVTMTAAFCLLPFLALEVLLLAPLTIDMRLITVRLLRWLALGIYRFNGILLPRANTKRKRDTSRLEAREERYAEDEPRYYIDDDGEIAAYR